MSPARYLSGLLMTFCLCVVAWETQDEMAASDDAGINRCDYAFECIQHRRCVLPIDEDCLLRLDLLAQARLSKRLFGEDKRTGKKLKNIALSSYLNRLG